MTSERDAIDDLLVLDRRGGLSEAEKRRLREALSVSAEARLLYEAGQAFDAEGPVVPGDDARIERIVRRVEKGRRPSSEWRRWSQVARAMAVGALVAGAAIGAMELSRSLLHSRGLGTSGSAPPAVGSESRSIKPLAGRSTDRDELSAAKTNESSPLASADVQPPSAHRATTNRESRASTEVPLVPPSATSAASGATAQFDDAPRERPEAEGSTALELFSAANRARVNGDAPAAITLYKRLQSTFPRSTEAMTAHLSLGLLYLQGGRAGLAFDEFRICRQLGVVTTMPEALWGESQALHELGRPEEERMMLEELLEKYPRSAYATAAQKRLAALN